MLLENNKHKKILMYNEEKNLILASSICDNNENLRSILSLFKKSISKKGLDRIANIDIHTYKLLNTRDAVIEMKDNSSQEWFPKEHIGKKNIPCQLCGSKKSEDKFVIRNVINNNELQVGTSCIHKFEKMNNLLYGIPASQVSKLSKQNPKKLERIVEFNEKYPGGKSIFSDWKNKYNKFEIIFPKSYDDEFNNLLKRGRKVYNLYIDYKINDDEVQEFKSCLDNFDYLYSKCEKFYKDSKNNKYICTKKIVNLLKDNKLKGTISYIQEKGIITKDIAKYVYHIEFVQRFKNEIKDVVKKHNLKLEDLNDQFISFTYEYEKFAPILLENSLKDFTYKFSDIFYGINSFNPNYIFKELNIKNQYSNAYNFLAILDDILKETGYYFYINEELYGKQQIELNRKGFNSFSVLDLKYILNNFNKVLYLNRTKSTTILLSYVKSIHKWIDKSDKEKYDIGNIAEVWTK